MTHLFINTNLLHNCWFYTRAAWFVEHDTWYQKSTKIKRHLLSNYLLEYVYCELFTEGFEMNVFHIYIYIYIHISKSVDIYTRYVLT